MLTTRSLRAFKTLDEVAKDDRIRIGGKAFNCARLKQGGFPVPDGLVVPTTATDRELGRIADETWFDALPAGTTFAVRSSGIDEDSEGHSFAGIHETQLNVTRAQLPAAVAACLSSAASETALAYRRAQHLPVGSARIGVLVQQMVAAAASGVAFTTHPVTGADEIVINSAWGLGHALVSGQVDPDEFTVRKRDRVVTSSRLGAKGGEASVMPSLAPAQLRELADILIRIERFYGASQDIEWCHDGRQFWIVQSRPVTTRRVPTRDDIEWTRANLVEVFPDLLSPQALAGYTEMLNRAERLYMGRLLAPDSELGPVFKAFHGRLYFNLSQLRRVCRIGGSPPAGLMRSMGHSDEIRPEDEIAVRPALRHFLPCLPDLVRLAVNSFRAGHHMRGHEQRMKEAMARLTADPRTLDDRVVWSALTSWFESAPKAVQIVLLLGSVMLHEETLRKMCVKVGFPYERLVYPQLAAGRRSVSTQQAVDLVALAAVARREPTAVKYLAGNDDGFLRYREVLNGTRFLEEFDRFLDRYGHRGRYESDWALPRYREDPAPLLFAVRAHLHGTPPDDDAVVARQTLEAADVWRAFDARLTRWQRRTLLPRARATARRLKRHYVWREQCRSDLTRVLSRLREWHLALAERFAVRGWIDRPQDYFLLQLDEIGPAIADPREGLGLRAIVQRRTAERREQQPLKMPLLMRESELPSRLAGTTTPQAGDRDRLAGLCVSPGCVEGPIIVMRDPAEFARMTRGAILVAPATDPSWTPLFTLAAGVIVEVGGMLSHASTIAREYGLPALANVKHATDLLRDGEWVRLDATGGYVRPLAASSADRVQRGKV